MKIIKKPIYRIYHKDGTVTEHTSILEVPDNQRDLAFTEWRYRDIGDEEFIQRISKYRRKIAMEE